MTSIPPILSIPPRPTRRQFLGFTAAALAAPALYAAHPQLKITAVEPYVLKNNKCFVLVRTSEGITGIGEASPMNATATAALISSAFAPLLEGMNPLQIDRCWDKLFYSTYKQGPMGLQPEALAAVDIALWDILGKVADMPIYQLLGGKRRESVRVYCSIGGGAHRTVKEMTERAAQAVERDFYRGEDAHGLRPHRARRKSGPGP